MHSQPTNPAAMASSIAQATIRFVCRFIVCDFLFVNFNSGPVTRLQTAGGFCSPRTDRSLFPAHEEKISSLCSGEFTDNEPLANRPQVGHDADLVGGGIAGSAVSG